jgi:hypothetical protein
MKLTSTQIEQTLGQFEAEPIKHLKRRSYTHDSVTLRDARSFDHAQVPRLARSGVGTGTSGTMSGGVIGVP